MRWMCVFSCMLLFQISAVAYSQKKVTLDVNGMEMVDVIQELRKQKMCIRDRPDKCREIILLKIVEGKKNKEIANQLGLAETTVKTQVQRAYRILREQLIPILLFISWLQNGGY